MNKKMREILAKIEEKQKEARGFADANETEKATAALNEIDDLQKQYVNEEKLFKMEQAAAEQSHEEFSGEKEMTADEKDAKAMDEYMRGTTKALSLGANGAVVPKTIANKIIETVSELSPIYSRCTLYNVSGNLSIPVYGKDGSDEIQAAYGTEFTDLTAHAGKFTSVDLSSLAIGALTKISKSLITNTDINVSDFVTQKIAKAIADFLEKELLVGTGATGHMTGATTTTNVNTLTTKTVAGITADILIDTQLMVPEVYQANACWIMNKDVFKNVRKFKDSNGDYIMTRDFTTGFGWTLLGKPVYVSDNMPAATTASAIPVLYGDFSGLACKLSQNVEIQALNEMYAAQHAVGVVGWVEADSKIENSQKFVGIKMSAT